MNPVIVSVSGGLSSVEAWERSLIKYEGKRKVIPVFADVGQVVENGRVVCGESEGLLRFLHEVETWMGLKVERIKSKIYTDVWDCFFKRRFLSNNRVDHCSIYLKRNLIDEWVLQFDNPTRVIGFSWLEMHRVEKFKSFVPNSYFPLTEAPYVVNEDIAKKWERRGVTTSNAYGLLKHDNCGGMCVKMGLGQAWLLWKEMPWRYEYNERREREFRETINPNVAIFSRQKSFITMEALRLLFESGYVPRSVDSEMCGGRCMMPDTQPDPMEDPFFN